MAWTLYLDDEHSPHLAHAGRRDVDAPQLRDEADRLTAYLLRLARTPDEIRRLRSALAEVEAPGALFRMTDREVIERMVAHARLGRVRLRQRRWMPAIRARAPVSAPEPEPFEPEPLPEPPPAPPPPPPEPTLDAARQAETLRRAAQRGAPFCEQCEAEGRKAA